MHIDTLSTCFNEPEKGIHCVLMHMQSTFNFEELELGHIVETEAAFNLLSENYAPWGNTRSLYPGVDGEILYPALVMSGWTRDGGRFSTDDNYSNHRLHIHSGYHVIKMVEKIKGKLVRGNNQKGQEPEHLGH